MNYDRFHKSSSVQKKLIGDYNFTYRLILESINKYLEKSDKVLDIGCGVGTLCLYCANKGNNVLGIDISDKAIESSRESTNFLKLKKARFETVNFPEENPSGKFDFVILTEVLEHLKDDELAIKKIHLLLNKNGRVLISTPSQSAPLNKIGYAREFDKKVGHFRRYKLDQLTNLLNKEGFTILESQKIEGVIRNFLFLNPLAGKLVRLLNHFSLLSNGMTVVDNLSLKLFGNSNYTVIAQKK